MNRKIREASEEYVTLVKQVADEIGIGKYVEMNVFDMVKSNKEVIKVKKTSEPMEVKLDGEDMIDVYVYEAAFDLVEDKTKRLWIENALCQVAYDMDKGKLILGKEPSITLPLGMYNKYKDVAVQQLELAALTVQQIKEKEKEEKEKKKAEKEAKKKKSY